LLTSAALAAAVALAGCETDGTTLSGRALQPISQKMLSEMASKNMSKESPILIRLFKQESELEVWKEDGAGRFALLKTFPICRWSGDLGPKIKEGDRQAPEGFYTITPGQMNPQSQYYLAFNMGFPNAYDKANDRTGAFLMIHGDCSSRGCYAMTDEQIAEIYALARESFFGGQRAFQIQAYPFRMTPANMAKHRNNPNMAFWKMLKEGYDHFEVSRLEPKVEVCEKRYVFNAEGADGKFSPRAQCPVYEVPSQIASAVAEKKRKDDTEIASLIGRGTPTAPVKMATDGGMHQVFAEALQGGRAVRGRDGEVERIPTSTPGTIPPTVNPPSNVVTANVPATPAPAQAAQPASPPRTTSVARAPAQATPRPAQTASTRPAQPAAAKPTQTASAEPSAAAKPTQTASAEPSAATRGVEATKNFFNKLFKKDEPAQTATVSPAPQPVPANKPASVVARPGAQPAPAAPAPSAAKPKPATALAEAKPTPLPEPAEESTPKANTSRPASPVSAFGSTPVVPAGSFGGGGFR
jgi:murein L,D-transpeptidase YafK